MLVWLLFHQIPLRTRLVFNSAARLSGSFGQPSSFDARQKQKLRDANCRWFRLVDSLLDNLLFLYYLQLKGKLRKWYLFQFSFGF